MLNPLIDKEDAAPAPANLFPDVTLDMPQVDEEEEARQPPPPQPPKEWTKSIYTFQDL